MSTVIKQMQAALAKSSPECRAECFELAFRQRHESTNELLRIAAAPKNSLATTNEDKIRAGISRTVPVFQALIDVDPPKATYRNFAELGFALKDQSSPEWKAARERLEEAARRRDAVPEAERQRNGFVELNIAACLIEEAGQGESPKEFPAELNDRITALLTSAADDPRTRTIVTWHLTWKNPSGHYGSIARWHAANHSAATKLRESLGL